MQRLLYCLSFDNMAALCAIMALASRHVDSLHDIEESPRSLRHMTAALRVVSDVIEAGIPVCNDATVFAVASLASTEVNSIAIARSRTFARHS